MSGKKTDVNTVTRLGILTAVALVLGYVEHLIPITAIPGVKLGLANTVLLYALYLLDIRSAILLMILKVGNILNAGFNQVYVMMTDEVKMSGEIIDTWIYSRGLGKLNYSLATAVGLLKSVLCFVMVFGTNKLARKWESAIW